MGVTLAACDQKPAYDWWWPKEIVTEDPTNRSSASNSRAGRATATEAENFRKEYGGEPIARDERPSVVAHWQGFRPGDPRMWDEDTWPVRLPHNPVQRAFRTVAFIRGEHPTCSWSTTSRKTTKSVSTNG